MNYVMELVRFDAWLETNDITKSAIALWYALMQVNNKTYWLPEFNVSMSTLELKTGFKRSELFKARDELQNFKRIIWKSRGGNLSANYQIIPFCVHNMDANGNASSNTIGNSSSVTNMTQNGSIHKLKETKSNKILEEENFINFEGVTPNDGVDRNLEGLIHFLREEISISNSDAQKVILRSNYGQKGTPIWNAIKNIRDFKEMKGMQIENPVNYMLKFLEGKNSKEKL